MSSRNSEIKKIFAQLSDDEKDKLVDKITQKIGEKDSEPSESESEETETETDSDDEEWTEWTPDTDNTSSEDTEDADDTEEASDEETPDEEASDEETPDEEASDEETPDEEASDEETPDEEETDVSNTSNPELLTMVDDLANEIDLIKSDGKIDQAEVMGLFGEMMKMVTLLIEAKPKRKSPTPKKASLEDRLAAEYMADCGTCEDEEEEDPIEASIRRQVLLAKVFNTKNELKKYLEEHPKADKAKHSVQESDSSKKEEKSKPKQKQEEKPKEQETEEDLAPPGDVEDIEVQPPVEIDKAKIELPEYNLEFVAGEDHELTEENIKNAKEIRDKVKKGIEDSADVCKMKPPVCKGNMGLTRDHMPQIMDKPVKELLASMDEKEYDNLDTQVKETKANTGSKLKELIPDKDKRENYISRRKGLAAVAAGADPDSEMNVLDQLMSDMKDDGIKVENGKVPVGELKATQREIKAGKTYGIANAYLEGNQKVHDVMAQPIIISSDNHILDGHHRYSAMLTADPSYKMNVTRVGVTMKEFLMRAHEQPGVFRADVQDNIIPDENPVDLGDGPKKINRRKKKAAKIANRITASMTAELFPWTRKR